MSLFDSLQKIADRNGDGKITKEDLDTLKSSENTEKINQLKTLADSNKDGKLDISDAKGFDVGKLAKDTKGLFGK